MTRTPVLNFSHLQPRAGSPEVPINEWMDAMELAENRRVEWDAGTKSLLTQDDLASAKIHVFTGSLSGQVELYVAGLNDDDEPLERFFVIENQTTENILVSISGQSGESIVVPPSFAEALHTDGVNVRIITFNTTILSTDGGGGSSGISGANVTKAANQTAANYTSFTAIGFDSETADVGGWHDDVTNNTRLTVPSGVNYVNLVGNVYITLTTGNTEAYLEIRKNGSATFIAGSNHRSGASQTDRLMSVAALFVPVVMGDYFELFLLEADSSVTVNAVSTNFAAEMAG